MKTIQPVKIWVNGSEHQATVLSAVSSGDNLVNAAAFSYQLSEVSSVEYAALNGLTTLASGYLTMTGEAYQNWQTNDYAYDWVAAQLNLTITGEYVPPAPPQTEPSPTEQTEI